MEKLREEEANTLKPDGSSRVKKQNQETKQGLPSYPLLPPVHIQEYVLVYILQRPGKEILDSLVFLSLAFTPKIPKDYFLLIVNRTPPRLCLLYLLYAHDLGGLFWASSRYHPSSYPSLVKYDTAFVGHSSLFRLRKPTTDVKWEKGVCMHLALSGLGMYCTLSYVYYTPSYLT